MWTECIDTKKIVKSKSKALVLHKFVKELASAWRRRGRGGGLITRGTGHDSQRIPPGIAYPIVSKSGNFKSWITNSNGPLTASFKCNLIYPKITFFYFKAERNSNAQPATTNCERWHGPFSAIHVSTCKERCVCSKVLRWDITFCV